MLLSVKDTGSGVMLFGYNIVFKLYFDPRNKLNYSGVRGYGFPVWQRLSELSRSKISSSRSVARFINLSRGDRARIAWLFGGHLKSEAVLAVFSVNFNSLEETFHD